MIFEESCDTEDWSNDAENSALHHRNQLFSLKCCVPRRRQEVSYATGSAASVKDFCIHIQIPDRRVLTGTACRGAAWDTGACWDTELTANQTRCHIHAANEGETTGRQQQQSRMFLSLSFLKWLVFEVRFKHDEENSRLHQFLTDTHELMD